MPDIDYDKLAGEMGGKVASPAATDPADPYDALASSMGGVAGMSLPANKPDPSRGRSHEVLEAEHAGNVASEAAQYRPSWSDTYVQGMREGGPYGGTLALAKEAGKGMLDAASGTMGRFKGMYEHFTDPKNYKSIAENPIVDLPGQMGAGLILGGSEALISPRSAAESAASGAIDATVMGAAGKAVAGIPKLPATLSRGLSKLSRTVEESPLKARQQGLNQIVSALDPGERTANSLDIASHRIEKHMLETGRDFKDMNGFASVARGASDEFLKSNYEPLSKMLKDVQVEHNGTQMSFAELEARRSEVNKSLSRVGYYDENPIAQSIAKSNPQVANLLNEAETIRGTIDSTLDQMAPTNVGAANMLREYSHLKQVADVSEIKAARNAYAKRIAAGEQAPLSELLKETAATLGTLGIIDVLGRPQMATRITRQIINNLSRAPRIDPDVLMARASNNLRKGRTAYRGTPTEVTGAVPIKPVPIQLPGATPAKAASTTGKIDLPFVEPEVGGTPQKAQPSLFDEPLSPVTLPPSTPPSKLRVRVPAVPVLPSAPSGPPLGIERRMSSRTVEANRRYSATRSAQDYPAVAQQAGAIKDALTKAEQTGNKAVLPGLLDELDKLTQMHPWIPDWLPTRDIVRGGNRILGGPK